MPDRRTMAVPSARNSSRRISGAGSRIRPTLSSRKCPLSPGGGRRRQSWSRCAGPASFPHEVIVRKDRPVGLLETRAADEFAVIDAVHEFGGVPVPRPFFAEPEGHPLGDGTLLVMERVPGHKAGEFFPDLAAPMEHRPELGRQLAASLARLHSLPLGPPRPHAPRRLQARPSQRSRRWRWSKRSCRGSTG